ncbi:hypothetical protein L6164_027637 [Bauhinia variegata]|uniref:Uncharacterized protein n=1 Tax=Bauhinia variegata TaxID=167791 RepID=A0ACB9LTW6_BAUVA|nr:hypothetical protein L6164_027637 [Bauhinia variegata]
MEPQQQQQLSLNEDGGSGKGGFLCRQSSTRWTPTTDQIRILKELYYNNGVRSPSAEQIQKISARLRQYGKIEGKNVFYWFQNHKARERQKKRFTSDVPMQRTPAPNAATANWKPQEPINHSKYYSISSNGVSSAPSSSSGSGMVTLGQMGNCGYGALTMEKSFRDCSISARGSSLSHNLGWVGVDPYSSTYTSLFDKIRPSAEETFEEEQENGAPELETLPLFPMHNEDIRGCCNLRSEYSPYYGGWYHTDHDGYKNGSRTSLELSLNSYTRRSPESN